MKNIFISLGVIASVIILGIFIVNNSKNGVIIREEQVRTAKSNISIQEKRRADLIPNLIETVKQYDQHEYELLTQIVERRNGIDDETSDKIQNLIHVVGEAYPELKSNENYQNLMTQLTLTENTIASYRENYNQSVRDYNRYCKSFPNNLFLKILNYYPDTYEALDYEEKYSDTENYILWE